MFRTTDNFDAFNRSLSDLAQRQLPFALVLATNDTVNDALGDVRDEIVRSFDNPTRWTQNAFFVRRATKAKPVATVERKTAVARRHYLEVQEAGGPRGQTGLEKRLGVRTVTPASGARLNASGNWSPAQRKRVLAQVGSKGSAQGAAGKAKFFATGPKSKLSPGIYQRNKRGLRKIVHFSKRAPRYSKRFQFDQVTTAKARASFPRHLERRLKWAIETAK